MKKDFVVNINKLTKAISQKGFGLPLILGTSKAVPYALYGGIDEVGKAFGAESEEYKIAARMFGQNPAPQEIAILGVLYDDSPTTLIEALNTLIDTDNDWYFLVCSENSNDVVQALSSWIDTQMKVYGVTTQDLSLPALIESEQTFVMYHHDVNSYVAEGLISLAATNDPGSITFKFKTVNGVQASNIASTELAQLHEDGGFSYVRKMGVLQTSEGITTSGEYIDVVMGEHWIKSKMEEECMYLAINNKKIPYDNTGISMLAGVARDVLTRATNMGIVQRDDDTDKGVFTIDIVKREDVPKNDIANRVYNGCRWTASLAGAIHSGTISGILQY